MALAYCAIRIAVVAAFAATTACLAQPATDIVTPLQRLATAGDAEATYHLGMAYHVGAGVERDPTRALELFRKATELGDPLAAYKLGCYYDGQGEGLVDDDPTHALRYKLVAAEAGYALAQHDVARLHHGNGDPAQARRWLERAVAQGWPDAMMAYAWLLSGEGGLEADPVAAAAHARLFRTVRGDTDGARRLLERMESRLPAGGAARVERIVAAYQPKPTALTIKSLSGQRAALELIRRAR